MSEPHCERCKPLEYRGLQIDRLSRTVVRDGQELYLTNTEFDLLAYFALNPDRIIHPAELKVKVWRRAHLGTNAIAVYVRYLREKLGNGIVRTVRGKGYRAQ